MSGESHLGDAGEQAAVRAIVIGEEQPIAIEPLDGIEKALQEARIGIRGAVVGRAIGLCQGRATQAIQAASQVDQEQFRFADIGSQLRRQSPADIGTGREGGDDQGQRRDHLLVLTVLHPGRPHRQGILAHRNGQFQLRAELQRHRANGIEQRGIFGAVTRSRHPVCRELDLAQVGHHGCRQVGQRLGHRHATGGRSIDQGQGRTLADGEGFAQGGRETHRGHRAIGHRHLPRTDHLIACREAADAAIADGNQEALRGDGGQTQHPKRRLLDIDVRKIQRRQGALVADSRPVHSRRTPEQHFERHGYGVVGEMPVMDDQLSVVAGRAQHGEGTALTLAQSAKLRQSRGIKGQHVAFLSLVGPDLARRHARLLGGHGAQFETGAAAGVMHQFRQGVGDAAGADVVDGQDRIGIVHLPAAVDHLLGAPLHLGIAALHRGEIEIGAVRTGAHRGGRTSAQADQHARAADLDQQRAGRKLDLEAVRRGYVADAAGDHDRLVVAAHLAVHRQFETTEIAGQIGPAEFVVECRRADRSFDHDLQCRSDSLRLAVSGFARPVFPGLLEAGNIQVGHRETAQTGLGPGAPTGRALVADLAARTGGGAGKRRDRRRVVVRLDLGENMGLFLAIEIFSTGSGIEALNRGAIDYRSIVGVGHHRSLGMRLVRLADHAEQGLALVHAIDGPRGIEDLVAAVLRVGLREHHQFDVGGIAIKFGKTRRKVIDLIRRQGQSQFAVGLDERGAAAFHECNGAQGLRGDVAEQRIGLLPGGQHRLGHAIVQLRDERIALEFPFGVYRRAALYPRHRREAALTRDLGRLRGPGRDCAQPRRDQQERACGDCRRIIGAEQPFQAQPFFHRYGLREFDEIPMRCGKAFEAGADAPCLVGEALQAAGGKRSGAGKLEDLGHDGEGLKRERKELYPARLVNPRHLLHSARLVFRSRCPCHRPCCRP